MGHIQCIGGTSSFTAIQIMSSATVNYELLLFLVNTLQTNAETISAQVITNSASFDDDQLMADTWSQLNASAQDEIAADVQHVLDGISLDLAFMI